MGFSQKGGEHAERKQKHQPRRVPEQDSGPDQRRQGLLEEPAHLLDHGQAIGGLYPRPFQAVIKDGIFVGRQVQRCSLLHHPDADKVGVAIGKQTIAIVDAPNQKPVHHVEAGFQDHQPPKTWGNPLVAEVVLNAVNYLRRHAGNRGRQGSHHDAQQQSPNHHGGTRLPQNAEHRRHVLERLHPLAPGIAGGLWTGFRHYVPILGADQTLCRLGN